MASDVEPWILVNNSFRDVTLVVEGTKLLYHKAVLVQHSRLLRQLLTAPGWCPCQDVVISLDTVSVDSLKYVMDLVYSGVGGAADTGPGGGGRHFKEVIEMLQIDTIVVTQAASTPQDNFDLQNFLNVLSSDKPRARGDVAVSPEDLLVSRSASAKARPRPVRSTAAAVDNAEALRSLKEEKNKVAGTEVEGATFSSKKKVGRKRKAEAESPVQPSASKDIKMKTYQGPVTKPTRDVGYEIIKTPTSFTKITSDAAAAKDLKKSREEECEIVIEDEVKKEKEAAPVKVMDTDRYMCPYEDCQSESKNAQSIKIHLALVHYKKTIQAEFPNWKKQKCEECDRSIGQMTAYYLHMANHKKYKYMDLSPDQLRVPAARKPPGKEMEPPISHPTNHEGKGSSFSEQGKTVSSPFGSANKVTKTNPKSFSPIVTPITKTGNYVKTGPMYKTSSSPGFTQVSRSSGFSSSPGYQVVRTTPTASKVTPKSYTATVTAAAKGPPGPGQIIRIPGPGAEVKPEPGAMRRMSDGFSGGSPGLMQRGYSRTANVSDKDKDSSKSSNKDNFKKQRGF